MATVSSTEATNALSVPPAVLTSSTAWDSLLHGRALTLTSISKELASVPL